MGVSQGWEQGGNNLTVLDPRLWNWSWTGGLDSAGENDTFLPSDVSFGLRILITVVYLLVCSMGLLGNGLVMYLIRARKTRPAPAINVFVFGLAAADFQFSLTLPFWATETALDFSWPFGPALCKVIPSVTLLSVYTNAFLLTAMSVTRYWSMASALRDGSRMTARVATGITVTLWALALGATVPTAIYATVVDVAGVELCLFKFPAPHLLGVYQLQRVVLTFVVPLAVILTSYLLLLRFLRVHAISGVNPRRQRRVATTVRLVVGCFFVCWFPNHVVTFWGVLVKFQVARMGRAFYFFHTYLFPLTTCLAHASSCLNPVLYCLIRREFREALKDTFRRLSSVASSYQYFSSRRAWEAGISLPLRPSGGDTQSGGKGGRTTLSVSWDPRPTETPLGAEGGAAPDGEVPT